MKKIFLLTSIIFTVFYAKSQLLWEISGNGVKKSYIFGTNHLVSSDFLDSIPNVFKAYNSCKTVVGEVLLNAKNISDTIMAYAVLPKGTVLKNLFTDEECSIVDKALKNTLFLSLQDVSTLKPAMILAMYEQTIYEKVVKKRGDFQLDSYFQQVAEMQGKKVTALENATEQAALLFGNQTLERQTEIFVATVQDSAKLVEDIKKIVDLYKKGNIDLLYAEYMSDTGKIAPTLRERHALLDSRNANWSKKISELIKKNSAFIAVGALHLSGENGLITLLKKDGYKVKPYEKAKGNKFSTKNENYY
jgi:uncharacterized protein YbaP (TraB family)